MELMALAIRSQPRRKEAYLQPSVRRDNILKALREGRCKIGLHWLLISKDCKLIL